MITNNFVLFSILAPQKQGASPVEVGPSDLFCVWRVYWWCTQTKDYCCFPTTDECDPLFTFNGPIGAHKLPVNLASCWGASHTKWMDGFSEATALLPQLWCSVLLASLTLLLRWRLPMLLTGWLVPIRNGLVAVYVFYMQVIVVLFTLVLLNSLRH